MPVQGDDRRHEAAAARRYRAGPGLAVVAAPGTQALIQRLPDLAQGRDVRVLGPTYDEYARVFRSADARVAIGPSSGRHRGHDGP